VALSTPYDTLIDSPTEKTGLSPVSSQPRLVRTCGTKPVDGEVTTLGVFVGVGVRVGVALICGVGVLVGVVSTTLKLQARVLTTPPALTLSLSSCTPVGAPTRARNP
jgi:hypothetical protein